MVNVLSALQTVPKDQYEAAQLDENLKVEHAHNQQEDEQHHRHRRGPAQLLEAPAHIVGVDGHCLGQVGGAGGSLMDRKLKLKRGWFGDTVSYVYLTILAIIAMFPMVWILLTP